MRKFAHPTFFLGLSFLIASCATHNAGDSFDRAPAGKAHKKPAPKAAAKAKPAVETRVAGGCDLEAIRGVQLAPGIGVLDVIPNIATHGMMSGRGQPAMTRDAMGGWRETLLINLQNDRAILSNYFNGNSELAEDLESAFRDSLFALPDLESSFQPQHLTTPRSIEAFHSALSFIHGNYTTSTATPRRTGHVMAAVMAAIMVTIDFEGCAGYFISEASKIMHPAHAAYLRDFPIDKIRKMRRDGQVAGEFKNLAKRRDDLHERIENADRSLAQIERSQERRADQIQRMLKLEMQGLQLEIEKIPACRSVMVDELAFASSLRSPEKKGETLLQRCREAIEEYASEMSGKLASISVENRILEREIEIAEREKSTKTDPGALEIIDKRIAAKQESIKKNEERAKRYEEKSDLVQGYRELLPLAGEESSAHAALLKIRKLSKDQKAIETGEVYKEDFLHLQELHRELTSVNRDYLGVGIFGGLATSPRERY